MSVKNSGGGIGFFGFLTLMLIGFKIGEVVDWSWWLVLAPLWAPYGLLIFVLLLVVIARGIRK